MAQRELKVKVIADISSELNNILKKLDQNSNVKLNVKINVDDGGLKSLTQKLDNITTESKKLSNTDVSPKASASSLSPLENAISNVSEEATALDNKEIAPKGSGSSLEPLINTLDQISDKVLDITGKIANMMFGDAIKSATELYDAQKSFENQMGSIGKSNQWINANLKALNEYGAKSKYSIAEMVDAFAQFEGMGRKGAMQLVTGVAGISSYSKNASQAMKGVNYQLFQMSDNTKVLNSDWRAIRNNIGGAATQAIIDWLRVNKGIEVTKESLSKGNLEAHDLFDAITAVGNSSRFQSMAKQVNTVSSAMENLQETMTAQLVGTGAEKGPLSNVYEGWIKFLNDLTDEIPGIAVKINAGISFLLKSIEANFGQFNAKNLVQGFVTAFEQLGAFVNPLLKLFSIITNRGQNTGKILGTIVSSAIAFKTIKAVFSPLTMFTGILSSLGSTASKVFSIFGRSSGASSGGKFTGTFMSSMGSMVENAGTMLAMAGSIKILASAYKDIAGLNVNYERALINVAGLLTMTMTMSAYMTGLGYALNNIGSLKTQITTGAIALSAIAVVTLGMVKSLQVIGNTKIDYGNAAVNLVGMATAFTAIGTFITAIGAALTLITPALGYLTVGMAALTAINVFLAGNAMIFTVTIKSMTSIARELNKMPQIPNIKAKMKSLIEVILAMNISGLAGFSTAGLSAIGNALGAIGNMAFLANIKTAMSTIAVINTFPVTNAASLKTKLRSIVDVIQTISQYGVISGGIATVTSAINIISNGLSALANKMFLQNIKQAMTVLKELDTVNTNQLSIAKTKIEALQKFINNINAPIAPGADGQALSALFETFAVSFKASTFRKVVSLVNEISTIQPINEKEIKSKLNSLKRVMSYLGGTNNVLDNIFSAVEHAVSALANFAKLGDISAKVASFRKVLDFVKALQGINLSQNGVVEKMQVVKRMLNEIAGLKMPSVQSITKDEASDYSKITKILTSVAELFKKLQSINTGDALQKIDIIKQAIQKIGEIKFPPMDKGQTKAAEQLQEVTSSLSKIAAAVAKIANVKDMSAINDKIGQLKIALPKVIELGNYIQKNYGSKKTDISDFATFVSQLSKITATLAKLEVLPEDIVQRLEKVKQAIKKAVEIDLPKTEKGQDAEALTKLITAISNSARMLSNLPIMPPDLSSENGRIDSIKKAITAIKSIKMTSPEKVEASEQLMRLILNVSRIANTMNTLPLIGQDFTLKIQAIKSAIDSLRTINMTVDGGAAQGLNQLIIAIRNFVAQANSLPLAMNNVGYQLGSQLVSGFNSVDIVGRMIAKLREAINVLNSVADQAYTVGLRLGDQLTAGFHIDQLLGQIDSLQARINSLHGKTIDININETTTKSTVKRANGGIIPEYHSSGGVVGKLFAPSGTDTVPAMLTPGEFVLKRSVVNALGRSAMEALNNLNISSFINAIGSRMNQTNNTVNNITQNVNNKNDYVHGMQDIRGIVRA